MRDKKSVHVAHIDRALGFGQGPGQEGAGRKDQCGTEEDLIGRQHDRLTLNHLIEHGERRLRRHTAARHQIDHGFCFCDGTFIGPPSED